MSSVSDPGPVRSTDAAAPGGATGATAGTREALAAGIRPRRFGAWYVAEHIFRTMRSYGQTVVFTAIGNPLIYLYALGVGLASLVDQNLGAEAEGVGYLAFVAPALLCSAAITTAMQECSYPVLLGYKWNPIFTAMHAAPIRPGQIVDGLLIATATRLVISSTIYFVFMLLFGAVPSPTGFLAVGVAALTGVAVGMLVAAYASTIEEDTGQLALVDRLVILPMTLFSGTFFPLDQLPWFLQWIGWLSPLWHGTELARVFTFGYVEPVWLSVLHVVYLIGLGTFGWIAARRIAVRRLAA